MRTVESGTSSAQVVATDLDYMIENLRNEFADVAGHRVLITGGAGFLGYYLVQALLRYNDAAGSETIEVAVMDNFMRGTPSWLTGIEDRPDLSIIEHDIRNPLPANLGRFHFVIHAAGIASPHVYRKYPIQVMDANVNGLRFLLDEAAARSDSDDPLSGFLFYSSSEIYGDPSADQIPTSEDYRGNVSCTGPRACYDESKRYGETLAVNFVREHGLPVTIARPFNNYGPGMKINDGRVLADFSRSAIQGKDIVMYSDGSPTRTFCYVADAVIGYYKVLIRGTPGEPYNIGVESPEVSMAHLAELVRAEAADLIGYSGKVVLGSSDDAEYLTDNPNRRCPDITKARRALGYEPSVGLADGVRRTLVWYTENSNGSAE